MSAIKLTNTETGDELKMEFSDDVPDLKLKLLGDSVNSNTNFQIGSYVEGQP